MRKSTSTRNQLGRGEKLRDDLRGEPDGSQQIDAMMDDREARSDSWSIEGKYIHRHHVEPGVQLTVPRKKSFPIPLRYIDLIRRTHTTLDVLQERCIDDDWNVDGGRELSEPWTDFTQFTMLNEKLPDGHVWSGERLTKIQATTRPDHLWSEIWSGMSKDSSTKSTAAVGYREAEDRPCAKVERHLSINPHCKEFKETISNARKKLELPMEAAMSCTGEVSPVQGDLWRIRQPQIKACMHRRSSCVHEAFGKNSAKRSWRSHCWKGVQLVES